MLAPVEWWQPQVLPQMGNRTAVCMSLQLQGTYQEDAFVLAVAEAVDKLGIPDIPSWPTPDHLRVWMFKVDGLAHLRLSPTHYLCIQYAWALQFTAATTTNAAMCRSVDCLTAFITSMSSFYTIMENMWWNHALTPPFQKPYQEFDKYQNIPGVCYLANVGGTSCTPTDRVLGWWEVVW